MTNKARELLAAEFERDGYVSSAHGILVNDGCGNYTERAAIRAINAALRTAPDGWVMVPVDVLDRFPEINPSNYDHDDACRLNSWGVELVLAAAQEGIDA